MDNDEKIRVCGRRYRQRRADGEPGWADESSYLQKRNRIDAILAAGRVPAGGRFLELGCGNGNVALYMARLGYEARGMDRVPESIDWARAQAREQKLAAHFEVGSVVILAPYGDNSFDFVFDANCLFMIIGEDRKTCIGNVFRVLKPGGTFYAEAHLVNGRIRERMAFSVQDYFDPAGQYSTVQGQPMYYFSREQEFEDLIEGAGFRIVRREMEPPPAACQDMPFYAGDMWVEAVKP